jgi:hypothetical protein
MNQINPLNFQTDAPVVGKSKDKSAPSGHWFEAMSSAWGDTLDKVAQKIEGMSDNISAGDDSPAAITALSTETMRMGFLSSSAKTAISSAGTAMETMARKG